MIKIFLLPLLLMHHSADAQQLLLQQIPTHTGASFRGLSVVDNKVAWVGGTNGTIGITTNGGNSWHMNQIRGYEQYDFRSVYAFDEKNAVIANAGTPAFILYTTDAGMHWKEVYRNTDTAAFLDGVSFWDNDNGIMYGDPVHGRLLMLTTHNGGKSWQEIPESSRPIMEQGEASFAASGTTIRCSGKNSVSIATGGKKSRLLRSEDRGITWEYISTPILQGQTTTGIFSFATSREHMIIVGGDYKQDTLCDRHIFISDDYGTTWKAPGKPTRGYRECVEYINDNTAIATGPTGTDLTTDNGATWQPVSDEKQYHVIRKSRRGNLLIMAGGSGKIGVVTLVESGR